MCRTALELKKIDVILDHQERELDYTTLKLAAERRVFVDISISPLIIERGLKRVRIMEKKREIVKLIKKFGTPFILTSGAETPYLMRKPDDLITLASLYGINRELAEMGISEYPVQLIWKKFNDRFILEGLEVVDERNSSQSQI